MAGVTRPQKKSPTFRRGLLLLTHQSGLAVLIRHLLPLTVGIRLLTARILLLLARLLAATLLLLTGLLARVLVLLTRVVLIGHWGISVVDHSRGKRRGMAFVARERRFRCDHCAAKAWQHCEAGTAAQKLALYKPIKPQPALLPPPVPTVRKCHGASSWVAGALAAPHALSWRFRDHGVFERSGYRFA